MINKLKIKSKLLLYSFFIQFSILITFSIAIYEIYKDSVISNIDSTLEIILFDIYHDLTESKIKSLEDKRQLIEEDLFDEEDEFNFEPLELRLSKIENNEIIILKNTNFPKVISPSIKEILELNFEETSFKIEKGYLYEYGKVKIKEKEYLLEAVTTEKNLNKILDELYYILIIIVPFILILATIGNFFLIYKSFKPIQDLLSNLKNIQINSLSQRLKRNYNKDEIDQLNKEINSLLSRLEVSFEKISQFSSNASHELKTPLTIIRGEIEIALRKDRTNNEYKETLINCQNEALSIQRTIEHLLFLAKSDDYLENNFEEVYLDEITADSINELQSYANIKKVHLNHKKNEALTFLGNKELLKIAIKNIIKNAISFSFENRTVQISNYNENNFNIIKVEDKGIGIKKEEQEKIFEEFYRTDKSRSKDSGGTGLGLTMCKKIISIHKGEISLKSEENIGTSIEFKLPQN